QVVNEATKRSLVSWCLRCEKPPGQSLRFDAAFGDPAADSFGERAPESGGFKILTVSRRSGLLPPRVVQITAVDRIGAEFVDEAKNYGLGVRRITGDRKSYPPRRSPRNTLLAKALGVDVVESFDHGTPQVLRDPLAVEHASLDRIDAAIAKLRIVVAGINHDDAARHVRKQSPGKIGDGLFRDRDDDDFSGFGGIDNGNGGRADLGRQRGQTLRSSRVRNGDLMAKPGEVARECPADVSRADDS